MQRLATDELGRIASLVPGSDVAGHMTFVHALLEGRMAGEVFVDQRDPPRTAFACTGSGFYFALGVPRADLVEPWLAALATALPSEEPGTLYATSDAWRAALDPVFPRRITRNEYRFEPAAASGFVDVPFGYQLVRLDAFWVAALTPDMETWVFRIWGGPEGFLENSFGSAIVAGVRVVSFCAGCAIGGGEVEIDIQTAPPFQGRGLATVAARAFLQECATRGLKPAWTAEVGNDPSDAVGRRVGFVPVRQITGYPLSLETPTGA